MEDSETKEGSATPFDLQPTLVGTLLRLRPLRPEDWDDLYAVALDPLIWDGHPVPDRYQEEVFRGFFREALESGGAFVVLDARDGRVIGSSRFHGYNPEASEIEIGWTFLARPYWGGVYNREMKELMLRHAPIRAKGSLSGRLAKFPLAKGDGKNRRRARGNAV